MGSKTFSCNNVSLNLISIKFLVPANRAGVSIMYHCMPFMLTLNLPENVIRLLRHIFKYTPEYCYFGIKYNESK